ncbi:MAG: type II toxin-antitoxin system RelE family toxin [Chloroflexota bacterium]
MYKIELRRRAQLTFNKLPERDFQAIAKAVKDLAQHRSQEALKSLKARVCGEYGKVITE